MTSQLHDFNGGIAPNGVFWVLQVPDEAVQITDNTLTIHLHNASVVDQLQFPPAPGNVPIPATLTFDITYTKSGMPHYVEPTSHDPLSPFTWAGEMWTATNSGNFSLAYNDGSFSASGNFSSSGNFGEMGTERNGVFVRDGVDRGDPDLVPFVENQTSPVEGQWNENAAQPTNAPKFKGKVPVKLLLHR